MALGRIKIVRNKRVIQVRRGSHADGLTVHAEELPQQSDFLHVPTRQRMLSSTTSTTPNGMQMAQHRKEIAELLSKGKQDYARIRVEVRMAGVTK
jgi:hypothetical protein